MAFELSKDVSTDRLSLQITQNGSDAVAQIPLGFDADLARNYSLMVTFSPAVGDGPGEFELVFFIIEFDEMGGNVLQEISDGRAMRAVTQDRQHLDMIGIALLTAVDALITKISPRRIHMSTMTPHLPNKALRKFNMIATLFSQKGYRSGKGNAYHGRHIWMIEKQ